MSNSVQTNFLNSDGGDIGGGLVTLDYFLSVYPEISQQIGIPPELWVWGLNSFGQLGTNDTSPSRSTPVTTFAGGTNWKQVSSGSRCVFAIKTDGTLWTWGRNNDGQLGTNDYTNRSTPVTTFAGGTNWNQVSCSDDHVVAIKTDGTLWTWGTGSSLGNNTYADALTPITTFAGGTDWKQAYAGLSHSAAIKTDGTLWVWGSGSQGRLGTNDQSTRLTPVTTFAGGNDWKQVSPGYKSTSAIKTDGTLWVWGSAGNGELGTNDTTPNRSTPVTTFAGGTNWKQVSSGKSNNDTNHTTAIKTDGTLWTWGLGTNGQLGNYNNTNRSTPVTTFAGGTNWKQVSGGSLYTAAIKTDGTLWTWGHNAFGQLGTNNNSQKNTPVTTFAGGNDWKQVSCGSQYHTAAIKSVEFIINS